MKKLIAPVLLAGAVVCSPVMAKEVVCAQTSEKAIAGLFDQWNAALATKDATQVTDRYWNDAVLLPTVSNTPRTTPAGIQDYFEHFLASSPQGKIDTRTIKIGCNFAADMGTYTFKLTNKKGESNMVAARYTYVYQFRNGQWKIAHHHSSAMPEKKPAAH